LASTLELGALSFWGSSFFLQEGKAVTEENNTFSQLRTVFDMDLQFHLIAISASLGEATTLAQMSTDGSTHTNTIFAVEFLA
jgi:hypothetical protein